MLITQVLEHKNVWEYIIKHNLLSQYKKAKSYLLQWKLNIIDFKIRYPKSKWIYQFKINKKYRAFWYFENNIFIIAKISDHQD